MHAYAGDDPLFLAMNARGQRETNGALGDLCVRCHAPVAVALGETVDGLNLDELDASLKGVTCYACHQVDSVGELHNNGLTLAFDNAMRGGIPDPVVNGSHSSRWSGLHDRDNPSSSDMCGSCHDVVLPNGVHLERTYEQWANTLYAEEASFARLSCNACHMPGYDGPAAVGGPERRLHDHMMPGVDVAITDWPQRDEQRQAVQDELDTTLLASLCVATQSDSAQLLVSLDNVAAGHSWPSGASHDRRAWLELEAYSEGALVWSKGVYADDEVVAAPSEDPTLWSFRDVASKADGSVAHMFWDVESVAEYTIPGPVTLDPTDPRYLLTHQSNQWLVPSVVDRVTMRLRIRPVGLDVIDDLIASGDLAPGFRDEMPVFDLGSTVLEWTPELAQSVYGDLACVP